MIHQIAPDPSFIQLMHNINNNFYNLKQEVHIKNALVDFIRNSYEENDITAFSEFPRGVAGSGTSGGPVRGQRLLSRDMCLFFNNHLHETIEIKYKYPCDLGITSAINEINNDVYRLINNNRCNYFILIIHERPWVNAYSGNVYSVDPIFTNREGPFVWGGTSCPNYLNYRNRVHDPIISLRPFNEHYVPINISGTYNSTYHFIILEFI